jgi:hypothetical protein
MAGITGIRRIYVIPVVTFGTFIRYGYMSPFKLIVIVVDGERSRLPIGGGGVALGTIIGKSQFGVIGIQ